MRTTINISAFALVFIVTPSLSFAMMSIGDVSKERAKKLGIEVRSQPSGPRAAWVQLEFKPEGEFKNFRHVSMEIREGEKLLVGYAPLQEKRSSSGNVVVGFMVNRAYLENISLRVVTGMPMNLVGYDLRLKDFVDLEKLDRPAPKKSTKKPEQTSPALPPAAEAPTAD